MSAQLWPDEVEELRLATRRFIRQTVIPAEPLPGDPLDEAVLVELRHAAKEAGVFAPHAPAELGGCGISIRWWSPILQEAGYSPIGPSVLNCMAPDEGNMHMLNLIATDAQRQRYLAPLVAGDIRSCFGMTEPHPGAGSDPDALRTRAERIDGGWRIHGHKRFISGAGVAAFCILMARTEATGTAPAGATMFLVPMDAPGVSLGDPIHTVDRYIAGGHPHVLFDGVEVGDDAVLGAVGEGFRYAQVRLAPARLTHCMRWLGLARRALDIAMDRAETRSLFGQPIKDLGIAQGMIAGCVIDIETSNAIIDRTAQLLVSDERAASQLSSVAKVHCSEAIYRVIDTAIQLCGGDGVSDGLPLAQYLNEVRPFRIYDGSNETHRWAIARRASRARAREVAGGEPDRATVTTRPGAAQEEAPRAGDGR